MSDFSSAAAAKCPENPAVSASSDQPLSIEKGNLPWCLVLIVVSLVAYNSAARNAFLNFDDDVYITQNSHVRAGVTWETIQWSFTTRYAGNWHPLTWLSHALDCELFGLNPAGHHYVSLLLHAINVVLLFLLLNSSTGFRWRSLTAAGVFALHPINVESVAWAAERKNVLSMLFFLLALYGYVWYARQPGLRRYSAVVVAYALALMCKPQVVTFPFLLCLWDYWPLYRIGALPPVVQKGNISCIPRIQKRWLILEKIPLLLLSAASALITMKVQMASGFVKSSTLYSLPLRFETALIAYLRYIGKLLWPANLAVLYPHPTKLYPVWQVGAAATLLILISVLALRARDRRYLVVGWLWFLGSLVPMIGFVQVGAQAMADRYAYIPVIGLLLMFIWGAAECSEALKISAAWLAVPVVLWLLALGVLTYRQLGYWHDSESIWNHTLAVTQDNFFAHDILGDYLVRQGRPEEGLVHYRAALAIRPEDATANMYLGPYEQSRGNFPAAIERYETVALYSPNVGVRATAYFNLGHTYRQIGNLVKAKQCFEATLELAPEQPVAMIGLGLIAEKDGDMKEAARQYSHAIAVQPTDVEYLLLADTLQQLGHPDEAKANAERAARLSPNLAEAQKTVDRLLSGR